MGLYFDFSNMQNSSRATFLRQPYKDWTAVCLSCGYKIAPFPMIKRGEDTQNIRDTETSEESFYDGEMYNGEEAFNAEEPQDDMESHW